MLVERWCSSRNYWVPKTTDTLRQCSERHREWYTIRMRTTPSRRFCSDSVSDHDHLCRHSHLFSLHLSPQTSSLLGLLYPYCTCSKRSAQLSLASSTRASLVFVYRYQVVGTESSNYHSREWGAHPNLYQGVLSIQRRSTITDWKPPKRMQHEQVRNFAP